MLKSVHFIIFSSKFDPLNIATDPISSSDPILSCQVNENNIVVNETDLFSITVSLIDKYTSQIVTNIEWQVN